MKRSVRRTALFALLLTASCTSYQPRGLMGGYDETQLDKNVFKVSFKGNAYTSADRAADLCLLRSADLTLSNGYKFFAIVDSNQGASRSTFTTPTQSYTNTTISGSSYGGNFNAVGSSNTTTYGGQTITMSKPSATNTIIMVNDRSEIQGMTYDAQFVYNSLSKKYDLGGK